tara:strand:+ start:1840 stop:1944 length:105 start_codon:yes stop_codon:yes gene_type:complete
MLNSKKKKRPHKEHKSTENAFAPEETKNLLLPGG